jgi:hypothetical protein
MAQQIPGLATYPALSIGGGLSAGVGLGGFAGGVSAAASRALALIGSEPNGVALDFTDMSCVVRDTTTPANNFSGSPAAWLGYMAPSTKWILGANGLYASGTTIRQAFDTSGNVLGLIAEDMATTLTTYSRRLDNAAWTKTNVTAATTTGVDGVAGSATRITATAANGTCLNPAVTSASAARRLAPFVRQVTGTGALQWTLDGGTTWTSFAGVTGTYQRIGVGQTVTNPQVGFRIVNNGDAFDIDFANGETNTTGSYDTSPMESLATVFTRNADFVSTGAMPSIATTGTALLVFTSPQTIWPATTALMGVGFLARFVYASSPNEYSAYDGTAIKNYPYPPPANVLGKLALAWSGTSITLASAGNVGAPVAFAPPWTAGALYFGSMGGNNQNSVIKKALILPVAKPGDYLSMLTS